MTTTLDELDRRNSRMLGKADVALINLVDIAMRLQADRSDLDTFDAKLDANRIEMARELLATRCDQSEWLRRWLVEADGLGHLIEGVAPMEDVA